MKSCDFIAAFVELARDGVGVHLRLRKDETVKIVGNIDEAHEGVYLFAFAEHPKFLFDEQRLVDDAFFFDDFVFAHKLRSDFENRSRHRRAEKQDATRGIGFFENRFDVFDKTHIEHFIAFIEDEIIDFADVERTAFDVILNAAGSADDDFNAAFQIAYLRQHRRAAVDDAGARKFSVGEGLHFGARLNGKFPRRLKDERFDVIASASQALHERQTECGSFSRSRTRARDDICVSAQKARNCENLNRRRSDKAFTGYCGQGLFVQTEVFERDVF